MTFNIRQISRVYPAGSRITSTNYHPVPMWNAACHMVILFISFSSYDLISRLRWITKQATSQCNWIRVNSWGMGNVATSWSRNIWLTRTSTPTMEWRSEFLGNSSIIHIFRSLVLVRWRLPSMSLLGDIWPGGIRTREFARPLYRSSWLDYPVTRRTTVAILSVSFQRPNLCSEIVVGP